MTIVGEGTCAECGSTFALLAVEGEVPSYSGVCTNCGAVGSVTGFLADPGSVTVSGLAGWSLVDSEPDSGLPEESA